MYTNNLPFGIENEKLKISVIRNRYRTNTIIGGYSILPHTLCNGTSHVFDQASFRVNADTKSGNHFFLSERAWSKPGPDICVNAFMQIIACAETRIKPVIFDRHNGRGYSSGTSHTNRHDP